MNLQMIHWQPTLTGTSVRLRPLVEQDFDELFAAASDPLIWEQHPDRERYGLERFTVYFKSGLECRGAVAICDLRTGAIIGSSRFTEYNAEKSFVAVGFTFLTRENWGGARNLEVKTLMLDHAFRFVDSVYFLVAQMNLRSQGAMAKIGGVIVTVHPDVVGEVVFKITKLDWLARAR